MSLATFQIERDAFGKLLYTSAAGERHAGVTPVRAFPIGAPDEGVSLVSTEGHELLWIERLSALPDAPRRLLEDELASREFAPEVLRLKHVSTFSTPSTWDVETDRGDTHFVLKSEDDIRRLGQGRLLIASSHGVQFFVRDRFALDRASQRLLERFL
ncbi:DUF1854 domain-containing protein [Aquabacterium sp.]|uniref:cyanophycin metabolism-associated DUF1854 family protein n=1 Tax=Aquabacterium sp. TaxID=1872578 RepID=UPI0035B22C10